MRIDVHAHYFTPALNERLAELDREQTARQWFNYRIDVSLERRLELMDEAGVDVHVLSPAANQPYLADEGRATEAARFINDYYKDVVDRYPRRFAGFGCVPLPYVDRALAEAARSLDELGYVGISLGCSVLGRPLDDPAFEPFWAELERRQTVVFVHPLGTGMPMSEAYGLTWMVGGCFEDTITALRLVQSGLTTRYPNVKIIVPHLGGTVPFLWRRLENIGNREQDTDGPTVRLRRLYYDTVNDTPSALRCTCDAVGADHIVFGTDFPYPPGSKRCAEYVREAGFSDAEVAAIMGGTAQALLHLPEPH